MDYIAKENPQGVIVGRDAQSAFNTVRREYLRDVLRAHPDLGDWIDDWLAPRRFEMEVDGRPLGEVRMTGGTPQGSPLSPALFTVYMSSVVRDAEKLLHEQKGMKTRRGRRTSYWPLSFIDDINGVRVGGEKEMDEALEIAGGRAGIKWDRTKDWRGTRGKHLGVVIQDKSRHQKYRCQKTKAAWEVVKRLNRLPASGKRRITTQQLLPILTYGCELHHEPSEQQRRLAYEIYRWTIGAYPGSRTDKVQCLVGLPAIEDIMRNKRTRWAASVLARPEDELRNIAEPILREVLEEDVELKWMRGVSTAERTVVVSELVEDRVEEWSDGSRMEGRAAGATRSKEIYLGEWATVADAEEAGVMLAWEEHNTVALDSQGVIRRIWNLQYCQPRSWIEEALVKQMQESPRELMWVKGHSGIKGNEEADRQARREVDMGYRLQKAVLATPAGIRSEFPIYPKAPKHIGWTARALKGLVHMVTDKGPQLQWLWEMGKTEDPACVCDGWTPQNAAHLRSCPWVGDGRGMTVDGMWDDEKWCEAVEEFLHYMGIGQQHTLRKFLEKQQQLHNQARPEHENSNLG